MAGLVPAIHALATRAKGKAWMPGTRPGMTTDLKGFAASPGDRRAVFRSYCSAPTSVIEKPS
jgi:hypothetical protein